MEQLIQTRFYIKFCCHLRYAVFYCWYPQYPDPSALFRNFHCHYCFRKVTPRTHSVPELIQVIFEISLVGFKVRPIYARASFVRLYFLEGKVDNSFVDLVLLAAFRLFLLLSQLTCFFQPIDDIPSLHRHYSGFTTTTDVSVPVHSFSTFGLVFL